MKAVRFHEYGEPLDVLVEETTEVPGPPAGQVRVRVTATGLNPADWHLCRGFMPGNLPRGIGYDDVGIRTAEAERVDARKPSTLHPRQRTRFCSNTEIEVVERDVGIRLLAMKRSRQQVMLEREHCFERPRET